MPQLKIALRRGSFFPLFFISVIVSLLTCSYPVQTNAEANQVIFDAQAVLPDNQRSSASYYDLKVQPGATQALVIKLKNTSSKPIKVKIEGNNAQTNKNGALDYSKHERALLGGPTFEEMISQPQTVALAKAEEKDVTFQLKVPAQGFDGTVLGGFYCYEDTKGKDEKSEGFSLKNKFAYTIGVQLVASEQALKPKFALTTVKPGLENGYLSVFATLENTQPVLVSQMDMQATVTKIGQKKVLRELKKKISFAPRTHFQLPISWHNEPLKKVKYELTIHLKADSGEKWMLKKAFEIKGIDEKLNHKAVEVKKVTNDNLFFFIILALCLVVILGLVWYIAKLRRRQP